MRKIIRNAVRCLFCDRIIESKGRNDIQTCSCGRISVVGGLDYLKRSCPSGHPHEWYEELSEWIHDPRKSINGQDVY